ncbi:hypothetical protein [Ferruginibacter albus]|uniref:hypothetical protein n=1 Tax=Ferruginibacter albus TaxID=2875540 RepID=UPI001CC79C86|nr:hypothetical protein [Ferruginibacter albus]UAY52127.1 hypothetical protein K9M53_00185 [Ferruginibacter albus]
MPVIEIDEVVLDFIPGSTGIVFFITRDGVKRKTPELDPVVFSSLCAVLEKPSVFDTDAYSFRNVSSNMHSLQAVKKMKFSDTDLKETSNFETWILPKK